MATSSYVGIDVSKDRLDVAMLGEERGWQVNNTQVGIVKLVHQLQELQLVLIVVEATGGYQRSVVDELFRAGLPVAVVNPARVRQFARACGLLAKTDKLDARMLAEFGQRVQPRQYEGKSEVEKQLSALLVRWKQVEEMLKAEQNRLRTTSASLQSSVEQVLALCWLLGHPPGKSRGFGVKRMEGSCGILRSSHCKIWEQHGQIPSLASRANQTLDKTCYSDPGLRSSFRSNSQSY